MADNLTYRDPAGVTHLIKTKDTGAGHVPFKALADKNGVPLDALAVTVPATAVYGSGTREYGEIDRNAVGSSSADFALPAFGASREILLHAGTRCFVLTGASGVTVTPATGIPLEAGEKFHLRVPAGHTHIAVIRDIADGFLTVAGVA